MTEQDREGFAVLMLGLGETYGEPVSDARMEIYFAALSDIDLADVRRAATLLARTAKFFPRPAELREGISGSLDDRAELGWMTLLDLVRRVGYMGSPDFRGDVALQYAALGLFGSWVNLCTRLPADGPELLGYRKQFLAAYRAYDNRGQRRALAEHESHRLTQDEAKRFLADVKARSGHAGPKVLR